MSAFFFKLDDISVSVNLKVKIEVFSVYGYWLRFEGIFVITLFKKLSIFGVLMEMLVELELKL